MGVYEGRGQLGKSMKQLQSIWSRTHAEWDDANARDFEERFIVPLEKDLRYAVAAMDHMAMVLASARRDCESS
jgi:hypothetical protein